MSLHLAEIAARVTPGRHCALLVDQAGWHLSEHLVVPPNITIVDDKLVNPETNTYNAGFSQQLTTNLAVHVDGIYTKTLKDMEAVNINTPDAVTKARPLPEWGRILQTQSIGSSNY